MCCSGVLLIFFSGVIIGLFKAEDKTSGRRRRKGYAKDAKKKCKEDFAKLNYSLISSG
jgi:hypothetical protein